MVVPNPIKFLQSIWFSVLWKLRGYAVLASDETTDYRQGICHFCPHYDEDSDQCRLCTCFIPAKTALNAEQCPQRRWVRVYQKVKN